MQKSIRGEISTLIAMGFLAVMAVAAIVTTTLNQEPQDQSAKATETPQNCPYDSGQNVPLGSTESNTNNMENRWPISNYPHEYDIFGPGYFDLVPNNDQEILNLTKTDGGAVDSKMNNFMASMFGFKPQKLVAAYDMKYAGAPKGADNEIKGNAPVLEVAVDPNNPIIKVPATGYDIGGGYEAMVVFAASDRLTIHIGRHEYFVGTKKCANGNPCSGGYWIYVKNICVDQKIQEAYNSVKAAQESAGENLNPINLPMVQPGQILGKATNGKIIVGVRDNGPFISTFKPVYWGGVSEQNYGNGGGTLPTATATPGGGGGNPSTATPQGGGQPTATPTAEPPTPTRTTCVQPNLYYCATNNTCTSSNSQCDGIPTNTPIPTPTNSVGGVAPTTTFTTTPIPTVSPTQIQNTNTLTPVSITNSSNSTFIVQDSIETVGQLVDLEGLNGIIINSI